MLENASLSICALGRMLQKVLANGSQILPAQTFLFLEFILTMCKSTSLIFLTVLACLTIEPETTQFGFDLLLPASLASGIFGSRIPRLILRLLLNGRLEASHTALILRKVLAIHRIGYCTVSDRGRRFSESLLNFVERQSGWHTPSVHLNHLGRYFVVRNRIRVNLMFHGNSSV